ncbi:MAG: hypothetical protein RIK87_16510 [Fuerstiella sp.]
MYPDRTDTEQIGDEASAIRCEMAAVRHDLRQDIDGVAAQAKLLADWRHHVRQAPWLSMAVAAAAAFAVVPSRGSPPAASAENTRKLSGQNRVVAESRPQGAAGRRVGSSGVGSSGVGVGGVGSFLIRLATTAVVRAAVGMVSEKIGQLSTGADPKRRASDSKTEGTA